MAVLRFNSNGTIYTIGSYELPIAGTDSLGGIKASQTVAVDPTSGEATVRYSSNGGLTSLLSGLAINVDGETTSINENGQLVASGGTEIAIDPNGGLETDTNGIRIKTSGSGLSVGEAGLSLEVASNGAIGCVYGVAKTQEQTEQVGIDSSGILYTKPIGNVTLNPSGGIINDTDGLTINVDGNTITIENNTVTGKVNPVSATDEMTQPVGVGANGQLYTTPSSGAVYSAGTNIQIVDNTISTTILPSTALPTMTQEVGMRSDGTLCTYPSEGEGYAEGDGINIVNNVISVDSNYIEQLIENSQTITQINQQLTTIISTLNGINALNFVITDYNQGGD